MNLTWRHPAVWALVAGVALLVALACQGCFAEYDCTQTSNKILHWRYCADHPIPTKCVPDPNSPVGCP